jgi:hypothetical protein
MKAIETKYLPCTDYRGSRIKAYDEDNNSVTIGYPHEYNTEEAHHQAALALCQKMDWPTKLIGGGTKTGYAWVFVPKEWTQ